MKREKHSNVHIVKNILDMLPTDEEIDKVFKLYKQYLKIGVYAQQRINMFDYIREHWND